MSIFNTINIKAPGLNKFDLSYRNLTTMDIGDLVPIMCKEMIPGDKFRIRTDAFVRMMPLANPTFQNLRLYTHYFFVPYRLIWDNWEPFITGNNVDKNGLPNNNPIVPPFCCPLIGNYGSYHFLQQGRDGALLNYLNMSVVNNTDLGDVINNTKVSELPLRAYWTIWNEWYRDQNVDPRIIVPKGDGNSFTGNLEDYDPLKPYGWGFVTPNNNVYYWTEYYPEFDDDYPFKSKFPYPYECAKRRYLKDYFTSALPWPQKGDDVMLPFGGEASFTNTGDADIYKRVATGYSSGEDPDSVQTSTSPDDFTLQTTKDGTLYNLANTYNNMRIDLANVTSATINDLRRSVALQRFFEVSARGGTRYIEVILSHFGVHSKDSRLQRPEFLGGGVTPIQTGEVLQTTPTDNSPLATMGGRGYAVGTGVDNGCVYRATEHGFIMCIASIVPESTYWQGIDRSLTRFDRLDYYWPEFAHLGEQEIKKSELYVTHSESDNETFGYAPRYAEYKFSKNEVHGGFVTDPQLKQWYFGRDFADQPALTSQFLEIPHITGPFAVEDGFKFLCDFNHNIDALRPMPYYSDPRLI